MIKEKNNYRLKYQYELVSAITGKSKQTIRKAMWRQGLQNSTEDFKQYLTNINGN